MARHLEHITAPLLDHLADRKRIRLPTSAGGQLLPPLEVARRCGEAYLLLKFFDMMEKLGHTDHGRQLELWEQLVEKGGYVLDLAQRIGLFQWLVLPVGTEPERWAYTAYCILLHSLHGEPNKQLFELATYRFLYHHYLGLYPKSSVSRFAPPEQLRQRAQVRLNKRWGLGTELKESFKTDEQERVFFSLRIKPPGKAWITLLSEEGERLKPTRIATYQRLLEELSQGKHLPENTPNNSDELSN